MNKQEKERKIEKGRDRGRGKRKEDKRKEIEPMQGAEKDVKAKLFLACAQESAREVCAKLLQSRPTLCDPMDCTPLSVGFSRQEYWNGLPCPPLGNLPSPRIKPASYVPCIGSRVLYH